MATATYWSNWMSPRNRTEVIFAFVFLAAVPLFILSCVSRSYWATSVIDNWVEVHVFNIDTRFYFEALLWTLIITSVQFYRYHITTLALYDAITIHKASHLRRRIHAFLQLLLSMVTLIAALVLAAWVFRALFDVDIMNKHQVDLGKILDVYVPWLHIDFLIAYFVAIDIITLGVNLNFSACAHCTDEQKREFAVARQGLVVSLLFGVLFLAFQAAMTQMHPGEAEQFPVSDNMHISTSAGAPLMFMAMLQLVYVVSDLWIRGKHQ